ncbi:hypothetical protein Tco_0894271 [Tanacetum coccineum]|uniref:RNA-directed DNA polymerase, eukaryota n=1 Tax=Tanacetum coccineum TaxID=301880 RepID=A0ABQ5CCK3_9ASTR
MYLTQFFKSKMSIDGDWIDEPCKMGLLDPYFKKLWVWPLNGEDGFKMSLSAMGSILVNGCLTLPLSSTRVEHGLTPLSSLYVGMSPSRRKAWDEIIGKVSNRLSKWKIKTLSIGGRLTLIKSVLTSLPLYHMSLYKAPLGVLRDLESLRRKFFNWLPI